MTDTFIIDPINRTYNNLAVELQLKDNSVTGARCINTLYWGIEKNLSGKKPVEAVQLTQRISGPYSIANGISCALALENLSGSKLNKNSRNVRNLLLALEFLFSHIRHFYNSALFDYVDITSLKQYKGTTMVLVNLRDWLRKELSRGDSLHAGSVFLPRDSVKSANVYIKDHKLNMELLSGYTEASKIQLAIQKMTALLGGRVPHVLSIVPGGIGFNPQTKQLKACKRLLQDVQVFIDRKYIPHVKVIANEYREYFKMGLYNNMLSLGAFSSGKTGKGTLFQAGAYMNSKPGPFDGKGNKVLFDINKIEKQYAHSRYNALGSQQGMTPAPLKKKAYSWSKALRYDASPMEVGPLARITVSYLSDKIGSSAVKKEVDSFIQRLNIDISALFSVMGRHVARAIECKLLCDRAKEWFEALEPGKKSHATCSFPESGSGSGYIESASGPVVHWVEMKKGVISKYHSIQPLDWYWSPRDKQAIAGPMEQMLAGIQVKDKQNPVEILRIIRSF